MKEVPIKTTCNACQGEGVLSTGQTFVLAGRIHPLLPHFHEDEFPLV
ncbi:MAG: hypothetical protein IMZ53_03100 [Thermoplasmata archaeon]|nr:hypothetical protein [Thermoplasmata archaeon]